MDTFITGNIGSNEAKMLYETIKSVMQDHFSTIDL